MPMAHLLSEFFDLNDYDYNIIPKTKSKINFCEFKSTNLQQNGCLLLLFNPSKLLAMAIKHTKRYV